MKFSAYERYSSSQPLLNFLKYASLQSHIPAQNLYVAKKRMMVLHELSNIVGLINISLKYQGQFNIPIQKSSPLGFAPGLFQFFFSFFKKGQSGNVKVL